LPEPALRLAVGRLVQQEAARCRLPLDGIRLGAPILEAADRPGVVDMGRRARAHQRPRIAISAIIRAAFSVPLAACMLRLTSARRAFIASSATSRSIVDQSWSSVQV